MGSEGEGEEGGEAPQVAKVFFLFYHKNTSRQNGRRTTNICKWVKTERPEDTKYCL